MRTLSPLGATLALCLALAPAARAETEIKIATLAPRGSVWMQVLNKMKAMVAQQTKGEVKLHFYPGQVQGDEVDVVRKMRTGQVHGGAFTTVGLQQLNPKVLVLQIPTLFVDYALLDRVRDQLRAELEATFLEKGYVLLGWGEIGKIYLFSKNKIGSLKEIAKQKVWAWTDDPLPKAMLRALGVSPRLLGVPQVLPGLNTGIIDTVYTSPYGCMALQWHTKVKYMLDASFGVANGATVITKAVFDKLTPEQQKILKTLADKAHRVLIKRIRQDNDKALETLKAEGLEVVQVSEADKQAFKKAATAVGLSFVPRYYPKELYDKVLKLAK